MAKFGATGIVGQPGEDFGLQIDWSRSTYEALNFTLHKYGKLSRAIRPNQRLWGTIREEVLEPMIDFRFESSFWGSWKPITQEAINTRKNPASDPDQPLVDTGFLRAEASAPERFRMMRDRMEYNFWPPYMRWAPFHDLGTRWLPARPWSILLDEDVREVELILGQWLDEQVQEWGRQDPKGYAARGRNVMGQATFGEYSAKFQEYLDVVNRPAKSERYSEAVGTVESLSSEEMSRRGL